MRVRVRGPRGRRGRARRVGQAPRRGGPLHAALARRGAAARLPRRNGSAANHPTDARRRAAYHPVTRMETVDMNRKLKITAALLLLGALAAVASVLGWVASARRPRLAPMARADAGRAWITNAVNAVRPL